MQSRLHSAGQPRRSIVFSRERDAHVCWLLDHHPVTAAMLVALGWFPSRSKALKRLRRLAARKRIRFAGTVGRKLGRPEHVYCRWRVKPDQLLHEVERAVIFAEGDTLSRSDFRFDPLARRTEAVALQPAVPSPAPLPPSRVHDSTQLVAQKMVREALARFDGNKRRVAQELGISRSYLYRLLQTPDRDQAK